MNSTLNGRLPRKQLAEQLDRFDSILDGLSDALNEAVADAAREGAKAAVRELLMEIRHNPSMAHLIQPVQPPVSPPDQTSTVPPEQPSWLSRIQPAIKRVWHGMQTTASSLKTQARRVITPLKTVVDMLRWSGKLKQTVWLASGIGVAAGTVTALCPHWVATMTSSVAAAATAFTVHTGFVFKNLVHRFRLS